MISLLPFIMIRCLLMTLLIECGIACLAGVRQKNDIIIILLVNVLTNPLVVSSMVAVNFFFGSRVSGVYEYIIEAIVLIAEGLIYRKTLDNKKLNPFILSLLLNAASYLSGVVFNYIVY